MQRHYGWRIQNNWNYFYKRNAKKECANEKQFSILKTLQFMVIFLSCFWRENIKRLKYIKVEMEILKQNPTALSHTINFSYLPQEIVYLIFSFFERIDLFLTVRCVCKTWKDIATMILDKKIDTLFQNIPKVCLKNATPDNSFSKKRYFYNSPLLKNKREEEKKRKQYHKQTLDFFSDQAKRAKAIDLRQAQPMYAIQYTADTPVMSAVQPFHFITTGTEYSIGNTSGYSISQMDIVQEPMLFLPCALTQPPSTLSIPRIAQKKKMEVVPCVTETQNCYKGYYINQIHLKNITFNSHGGRNPCSEFPPIELDSKLKYQITIKPAFETKSLSCKGCNHCALDTYRTSVHTPKWEGSCKKDIRFIGYDYHSYVTECKKANIEPMTNLDYNVKLYQDLMNCIVTNIKKVTSLGTENRKRYIVALYTFLKSKDLESEFLHLFAKVKPDLFQNDWPIVYSYFKDGRIVL